MGARHGEGLAEAPRPGAEAARFVGSAPGPHEVDAVRRLNRPDEFNGGNASLHGGSFLLRVYLYSIHAAQADHNAVGYDGPSGPVVSTAPYGEW